MYKIIGADQKEYGPISNEQLRQWIAEGRADARTRVLPDGGTEWKELGTLPEFADAFGAKKTDAPGAARPATMPMPVMQAGTNNTMATTGLVMGILALIMVCCCYGIPFNILGIVFSCIALSQIKKNPEAYGGRGMALTGLILSIVSLLLAVVILIIGVTMNLPQLMQELNKQ